MFSRRLWKLCFCLCVALISSEVTAQIAREEPPKVAQDIGVDQKLGDVVPLDLSFNDENNNFVKLRKFFSGTKPVLLSFNYSDCPKLCSIQLQNLAMALQDIRLVPGKDFELVIVSIDPLEQSFRALELKQTYLALYGKLDSADGWHVLTGKFDSIQQLTNACGYRYKYVSEQKIYSHKAAFIFCSPDGTIARYLDGLDGDLRFKLDKALIEAGEGKVGSLLDRVLYFSGCYVFDEHQGRYTVAVMNIMRMGGAFTVLTLAIWLIPSWVRMRKHAKSTQLAQSDMTLDSDSVVGS